MKEIGDDMYVEQCYIEENEIISDRIKADIITVSQDKSLTYGQKKLKILAIIGNPTVRVVSEAFMIIKDQEGFDFDSANSILCSYITALFMDIHLPILKQLFEQNGRHLNESDLLNLINVGIDILHKNMKEKAKIITAEFYNREVQ